MSLDYNIQSIVVCFPKLQYISNIDVLITYNKPSIRPRNDPLRLDPKRRSEISATCPRAPKTVLHASQWRPRESDWGCYFGPVRQAVASIRTPTRPLAAWQAAAGNKLHSLWIRSWVIVGCPIIVIKKHLMLGPIVFFHCLNKGDDQPF